MNQSLHSTYQFKIADTLSWGLVKRFHKQTKLSTPLQSDRVFLVLKSESIIGVARFIQHHQAWWLRGLYILPEYRQKHLATQLIEFALKSLGAPCYAFAQPNLEHFYQTLNFQPQNPTQLPNELAELYKRYQASKTHLKIWYRA
ncbi:GNAT family N-acetyltransferase [Thiomicrospira pelophila]|uniref:GNAT family N-acetyltransferase n=1 Tax=Thiomicrospira pelophila TaxID=934 RepID=UPI00057127E5|nr:GNAT family N-acetyltransferase [Thiomicrospira pelophila]